MIRTVIFAAAVLVGDLVQAGTLRHSHLPLSVPNLPPPVNLSWEWATATNEKVGVYLTGIMAEIGSQQFLFVTEANAPSFGVDWAAFEAAAMNPAYNQSIVTFGSFVDEAALVGSYFGGNDKLGSITIALNEYTGGPFSSPWIHVSANSPVEIPEPATWFLLLLVMVIPHRFFRPHQPVFVV